MKPSKPVFLFGAVLILVVGLFLAGRGLAVEDRNGVAKPLISPTNKAPETTIRSQYAKASHTELRLAAPRDILESALANYQTALAVIANNVANAETSGFKASRVIWEDEGYRDDASAGVQDSNWNRSPNSCSIGSGSRIAAIQIDLRQGRLENSGCELDLAIDGDGYFIVQDPQTCTLRYYRGGRFAISEGGQ